MRRTALLAASLLLAACLTGCHATPPYAVAFGDSLTQEAGSLLAFGLHNQGYDHTDVHAYGGTSPCDWTGQVQQEAAKAAGATVAVLEFVGNPFSTCVHDPITGQLLTGPAFVAKYQQDMGQLVALLTKASIHTYVLSVPTLRADAQATWPDTATPAINAAAAAAARDNGGIFLDAAGQQVAPVLNPDRSFAQTLPCLPWETGSNCGSGGPGRNAVRAPDGEHFCPQPTAGPNGTVAPCPVYASGATRYALWAATQIPRP